MHARRDVERDAGSNKVVSDCPPFPFWTSSRRQTSLGFCTSFSSYSLQSSFNINSKNTAEGTPNESIAEMSVECHRPRPFEKCSRSTSVGVTGPRLLVISSPPEAQEDLKFEGSSSKPPDLQNCCASADVG
jgi:hypothetical protein